ncbi:MAG TPA: CRTAC1 family protein [Acidobacteriaceae bacterium]|nr:CRTAC1 family protein [Acidobacteriaceae bacterium]
MLQLRRAGWMSAVAIAVLMACAAVAQTKANSINSDIVPGKFVDVTAQSGVHFVGQASHTAKKYLIETMGSGVALFDYDNDGRLDIFFANGAPVSDPTAPGTVLKKPGPKYWDRLYHQLPNGTFEDVTQKAGLEGTGYDMGVAVGDYDNDGYEDLYVTGVGGNHLYHNNGNGTFTDVTKQSGTGGSGWSSSAAWVDLNNDGLLDLVVLRYAKWNFDDVWCGQHRPGYRSYCLPTVFPKITPIVYINDGNGHFTEESAKIGIDKPGYGLGIAIADYDRDGHIDIAVANDSMPEFLYHNKGNGTFEEDGLMSGVAVDGDGRAFAGMGIDFQDYNNDGYPDLFITDLANQKYALFKNDGDGTFDYESYVSGVAGITLLHSGWGTKFFDYDNDGLKDLIVAQGHDMDNVQLTYPDLHYKEPMLLLRNMGNGKFVDVSKESGAIFHEAWAGRGLAVGDLNNDGREDLVVTTNDGPAYVIMNETPTKNHWLELYLVGHKSNRDAIGAVIKLTTSKGSQWWTVSTAGSYLSSSDKRAHFGLGTATEAKTIEIQWPSGIHQVLHNVKADQILRVDEPATSTGE